MKKAPVKEVKKEDDEDKVVNFMMLGAKTFAAAPTNKTVNATVTKTETAPRPVNAPVTKTETAPKPVIATPQQSVSVVDEESKDDVHDLASL
jgi:hypothetical protein